ncbi:MAG TPA: TonB-dependent hemoglobin/transferrin/lactoferrin family receptor [Elainellaceae cyanobacterium]
MKSIVIFKLVFLGGAIAPFVVSIPFITTAWAGSLPSAVSTSSAATTDELSADELPTNEANVPQLSEVDIPLTSADWLAQDISQAEENEEDEESEAEEGTDVNMEVLDNPQIRITVTGTRTPRTIEESPANVTVIEFDDINRILATDIRELVRYEPGVSVRRSERYGFQDFTIRGLGGNRVLLQVDGIRVPARFEFGPFQLGRDYVDIETLNSVEIIRGPASALYGSDALAGVVSYFTLDPSDLLARVDGNTFSSASTNFDSANDGFASTGLFASRLGNLELLFGYTRRDRSEFAVAGDGDFVDEEEGSRNNFLGTLVYRFDEFNSLNFTAEVFDDDSNLDIVESNLTPDISFEDVELNTNRERFSLAYEYDNPDSASFLQFGQLQVYFQNAREEELREREFIYGSASGGQFPIGTPTLREDDYDFLDRVWGANLQLRNDFGIGNIGNRLTYGIEVSNTRNERPRDRTETNLLTGEETQTSVTDTFPVEDFPQSDTFRLGLYVQDEISLLSDRLAVIPGLRFDYYDLTTDPSEAFSRNGAEAVDYDATSVSPSLSLVYQATPGITLVGRYARGFRAPLYSEINSGFTNLSGTFFKYRTISNPDLEAETSNTFELGIRGNYPQGRFSLTGFYSRYDDFIESFVDAGTETLNPAPPFGTPVVNVFQTQNVSEAEIYGLEFGGEYRFSPGTDGFRIRAALAWTVGNNLTTDEPLLSVDPFELVAGLGYQAPEDKWGIEFITTVVGEARTDRDADPLTGAEPFLPGGFTLFDLIGYYRFSPNLALNLGLFNIFDEEYYRYADVRTFNERPDIERFQQPGRSIRAGLTWRF